jgi:hypothetical protein
LVSRSLPKIITEGIVIDATFRSAIATRENSSGGFNCYLRTRSDDKARARTEKCSERYVPMVPP